MGVKKSEIMVACLRVVPTKRFMKRYSIRGSGGQGKSPSERVPKILGRFLVKKHATLLTPLARQLPPSSLLQNREVETSTKKQAPCCCCYGVLTRQINRGGTTSFRSDLVYPGNSRKIARVTGQLHFFSFHHPTPSRLPHTKWSSFPIFMGNFCLHEDKKLNTF